MKALNKITLLCGVALASVACNLSAQTAGPNPSAAPAGTECPKAHKAGKQAGHKLMDALNLSDEQKAKMAPVLQKAKSDAKAVRADQSLSKQQKHQQLEALRQSTAQQLQAILTPEQFQKFQQLKSEHKAGHGNENPAAPTT